jgi:hypothetical protein
LRLEQDQSLDLGGVEANLSAAKLVAPWMQYALALISSSLGDRPIYFSSNGGVAAELGLQDGLVRQGLAFKLAEGGLTGGGPDGAVHLADSPYSPFTGRWVHAARTRTLLDQVFVHHSGIPEAWSHWPDDSTIGIPNYYAWAYLSGAIVAAQMGDGTTAERYMERNLAWTTLGS